MHFRPFWPPNRLFSALQRQWLRCRASSSCAAEVAAAELRSFLQRRCAELSAAVPQSYLHLRCRASGSCAAEPSAAVLQRSLQQRCRTIGCCVAEGSAAEGSTAVPPSCTGTERRASELPTAVPGKGEGKMGSHAAEPSASALQIYQQLRSRQLCCRALGGCAAELYRLPSQDENPFQIDRKTPKSGARLVAHGNQR